MKNNKINNFYLSLLIGCCLYSIIACNKAPVVSTTDTITSSPVKTHVTSTVLRESDFSVEIYSHGEMISKEKVDVALPGEGYIVKLQIARGQRVQKTQVLAKLDKTKWQQEYDLLLAELEEKKLQLEAKFISLGFASQKLPPEDLVKKVEIELGLPKLQKRIDHKITALNDTEITAPISGIIADLEAQEGNPTSSFKKLCTIINDQRLEVKFPILESEFENINKGRQVWITPFYSKNAIEAKITSIEPFVDEHGMIWVYADLATQTAKLLDGMKVSVVVSRLIASQRVLPKSAILDRQDRYVIFVYKQGLAHWMYCHIDGENSKYYTLKDEGPQIGDTVIISNNFNLAHLEPVVIDSIISLK